MRSPSGIACASSTLYGSLRLSKYSIACSRVISCSLKGRSASTISLHQLLELDQILVAEVVLDVEVVVEAGVDRRTDGELGVGPNPLDRVRHHVGGRVPEFLEVVHDKTRWRGDSVVGTGGIEPATPTVSR